MMRRGYILNTDKTSSYPLSSALVMQCEQLQSVVLNKTTILNDQSPVYIRQLLAQKNLTLRLPTNIPDCVAELERLLNRTNAFSVFDETAEQNYRIQERSRSLIVFIILIAFVSFISIIGNLCLAKVLYSKRFRLLQTDRIVLCLAISKKIKGFFSKLCYFEIFR
jgi:hypothetical protein